MHRTYWFIGPKNDGRVVGHRADGVVKLIHAFLFTAINCNAMLGVSADGEV